MNAAIIAEGAVGEVEDARGRVRDDEAGRRDRVDRRDRDAGDREARGSAPSGGTRLVSSDC